jgi:hypothetical protein
VSNWGLFLDWVDRNKLILVSLYLINLGVWIVWISKGNSDISHVGESIIVLGAGVLKFDRKQEPNAP